MGGEEKALGAGLPTQLQTKGSIPFMITREMRQALADLNYSRNDIDRMKPERAWEIINSSLANEYAMGQAQAKTLEIGICPTCQREGILFSGCTECGEFIRARK
jgi:hypothetical protein